MASLGSKNPPNYIVILCVIILVIVLVLVLPTKCYEVRSEFVNDDAAKTDMRYKKSLFVFGDSLFDAGNNQYYTPDEYISTNHNPYGMSFIEPTGRCSDGLVVPDFIAQYAKLPLIPAALDPQANGTYGYNFASAGAGVLDDHVGAINLNEQLKIFKNKTRDLGERVLRNGVYLFSMGGNDYFQFIQNNENATEAQQLAYINLIIGGLTNVIKEIYEIGGRKFAFQDVGPLGCTPMEKYIQNLTDECYERVNVVARLHNSALREALYKLMNSTQHGQIKYGVFDYYNQLALRILNPATYGFVEGEIACCGYGGGVNGQNCGTSPYFLCSNPSVFVMFDGAHTTQSANSQLSRLMWDGDQTLISPYNIQQLFEMSIL